MSVVVKIEDVDDYIYDNEIFDEGCEWVILGEDMVSRENIEDEDFYIEPTSWKGYIPDLNLWLREGVAMQRYEDGEMMADFDVSILFDDNDILLYWEQDPPHVTLHNFLTNKNIGYRNFDVELHLTDLKQ